MKHISIKKTEAENLLTHNTITISDNFQSTCTPISIMYSFQ